ncbi:MAG: hypothetical protein MJZ99_06975 [Bacteroidales bacterium]|nr:hypothetical protein [Bacteroidales bacterium]
MDEVIAKVAAELGAKKTRRDYDHVVFTADDLEDFPIGSIRLTTFGLTEKVQYEFTAAMADAARKRGVA